MVNGKAYTLGCGEGEEAHLKELAVLVDAKAREAQNMVGNQASDTKLLLTRGAAAGRRTSRCAGKAGQQHLKRRELCKVNATV